MYNRVQKAIDDADAFSFLLNGMVFEQMVDFRSASDAQAHVESLRLKGQKSFKYPQKGRTFWRVYATPYIDTLDRFLAA